MTLKTTKGLCAELQKRMSAANLDDQTDTLRLTRLEIKALCHDAGRAEELEKEIARLDAGWTEAIEVSNAFYAQTCKLQKENNDLHARLDRYTRIAESGKSYGDDLDNIERIAELEFENTQEYLDIERALSGQRLLYNRPLAIRVADLRAKHAALQNVAERISTIGVYEIQEDEGPLIVTPTGSVLLEELDLVLKEQEKV